jgi:hypothetical protein
MKGYIMNKAGIIIILVVLSIFFSSSVFAINAVEKDLDKKLKTAAFVTKDYKEVLALMPRLRDIEISDKFRLYYCKLFLMPPHNKRLPSSIWDAAVELLVFMDEKNKENKKMQLTVRQTVKSAMDKIKREKEFFSSLLKFYTKIEDAKTCISKIRHLMPRFRDDPGVLNAIFEALENQRVKESVNIINQTLYNAYIQADEDGLASEEQQKRLMFLGQIHKKARWALHSLTGQVVRNPEDFNKWWMNKRGKFKVQPKKKPEDKDKDKKKDNDKDKDKDKKEEPKKDAEKKEPPKEKKQPIIIKDNEEF